MENNLQKQVPVQVLKQDEKILVVAKKNLFSDTTFTGFLPLNNFDQYEKTINLHKEFLWRSAMENDPTYKQVCPYLIFNHADKFFIMQRKSSATEQRLKSKYTLGSGGHLREGDVEGRSIAAWAEREFDEEIFYQGSYTVHPFGIINDESNLVGQVHIGFVFILKGDSDNIQIKSELKRGSLMTLDQCTELYGAMEPWSQLLFPYLKQHFNALSK
jgi:predicted NUDIX family phosphoesterase